MDRSLGRAPQQNTGFRFLDFIERAGNRLPDPVTLFLIGALLVLVGSDLAVRCGWEVENPAKPGETIAAISLLSGEGMRWVWLNLVKNFTDFQPLGVVLVAMLGIGVAERVGLIAALLKIIVLITPQRLLTPAAVFVGVNSSVAADAGYVVLPPLVALVYAKAGRAPLAGLAAVFAGVAGGFSANLLPTALDPLLAGLTEASAHLLNPGYAVNPLCNYYFMIASTFLLTLVGWGVTKWFVENRFTAQDIQQQIAEAQIAGLAANDQARDHLTNEEKRGLLAALSTVVIVGGIILALALLPGWPLQGEYIKPSTGKPAAVWADAIVPIIFITFLVPAIGYGIAARTLRSDRDVARMMGLSMSSMGAYIVLAFFAAQFVTWFNYSRLGTLIAIEGVRLLQSFNLSSGSMLVGIILLVALLNLFLGSASAKWALIAPVFVPLFMGLGFSPELTQAAYRVGDSVTNSIAPLNPYLVIILVFMQKYMPRAGLGSLVSLMLPYAAALLLCWTALLLAWVWLDLPLGVGRAPLFIPPLQPG